MALGVSLLAAYLALAVTPDSAGGQRFLTWWWVVPLASLAVLGPGMHALARRSPWAAQVGVRVGLATGAAALTLLAADNAYWIAERLAGRRAPGDFAVELDTRRLGLSVQRYYPTEKNFQLYHPGIRVSGYRHGDLYSRALLQRTAAAHDVLSPVYVTFSIDRHGFRETTPLADARVFALGDSFTFSAYTRQDLTWVKCLERRLGVPTYNLGVNGASPGQEYLLLRYVLDTQGPALNIEHVLWMIFEGNDLEDDYEVVRPPTARDPESAGHAVDLAQWLMRRLGAEVRERSMLYRVRPGALGPPPTVYASPQHGLKAFHAMYVARAGASRAYVESHPNRQRLVATFLAMQDLSRRAGFAVTVVVAPSDARLYGARFTDFPPISAVPHFIEFVADLARRSGFGVLNLESLLRPYAERELLYHRDDTHWNERGHEIVATLIAAHVFGR